MPSEPSEATRCLLTRAVPYVRLAGSEDQAPEVLPDGSGLRCRVTGRVYPLREGVLDLLGSEPVLRKSQKILDTPWTALAYDRLRQALLPRVLGLPRFPAEVKLIQGRLRAGPGDAVLDLACGHGNFTVELARAVGPGGLVIGLDVSRHMLARAVGRVGTARLENVLLVRGDAQRMPFAGGCFQKVNCSGGFHQFPDLRQALAEIGRVSGPRAVLTAATFAEHPRDRHATLKRWLNRRFAWHFVPLAWLGDRLRELQYSDYDWSLPGGWFAYTSAVKRGPFDA
jgi:SAM-dependent methyltransferase